MSVEMQIDQIGFAGEAFADAFGSFVVAGAAVLGVENDCVAVQQTIAESDAAAAAGACVVTSFAFVAAGAANVGTVVD